MHITAIKFPFFLPYFNSCSSKKEKLSHNRNSCSSCDCSNKNDINFLLSFKISFGNIKKKKSKNFVSDPNLLVSSNKLSYKESNKNFTFLFVILYISYIDKFLNLNLLKNEAGNRDFINPSHDFTHFNSLFPGSNLKFPLDSRS